MDSEVTLAARQPNRIAGGIAFALGAYAAIVSLVAGFLQLLDPSLIELSVEQRDPIFELAVGHGAAAVIFFVAWLRFRRAGARRPTPKLMLALTPPLMLLSADRILNVIFPPPLPRPGVFQPHPRRGWTLLPGAEMTEWAEVRIDRYGLRVRHDQWRRTLGDEPRVLFLGDSVTFGYRLPAEDGFVEVVADLLAKAGDKPALTILNGGTTAYAPCQELDWLTHEGAALSPDLVVVQVSLNDVSSGFHASAGWDPSVHPEFAQVRIDPHWSAFMRMAFEWGRTRRYGKNLAAAAEEIEELNLSELFEKVESERVRTAWARAEKDWRRMVDFCRSRKIPIVFFVIPIESQILDPTESDLPQQRLLEFTREIGVDCLDPLPALRRAQPIESAAGHRLYIDHAHPSRWGARIVASEVVSFLQDRGCIDRVRLRNR